MEVSVVDKISRVSAEEWDALTGESNPFIEHAFLSALEESGSVGSSSGWSPAHVLVRDDGGKLVGAAPLYVKDNSYGEYIFDWGWARASEQAGLPYYPKLVAAVPFTPAQGRRLLTHPDAGQGELPPTATTSWARLAASASIIALTRMSGDTCAGRRWRAGSNRSARSRASNGSRPRSPRQRSAIRTNSWSGSREPREASV